MRAMLTVADINAENEKRFWKFVAFPHGEDDCWIWTGPCFVRPRKKGDDCIYPKAYIRSIRDGVVHPEYARRFAWWMVHGVHLDRGSHLVNLCGAQYCVNPRHFDADAPGATMRRKALGPETAKNELERLKKRIFELEARLGEGSSETEPDAPARIPSEEEFMARFK